MSQQVALLWAVVCPLEVVHLLVAAFLEVEAFPSVAVAPVVRA